jgi:hypothetical protein
MELLNLTKRQSIELIMDYALSDKLSSLFNTYNVHDKILNILDA